jgi:hypothetical protein
MTLQKNAGAAGWPWLLHAYHTYQVQASQRLLLLRSERASRSRRRLLAKPRWACSACMPPPSTARWRRAAWMDPGPAWA